MRRQGDITADAPLHHARDHVDPHRAFALVVDDLDLRAKAGIEVGRRQMRDRGLTIARHRGLPGFGDFDPVLDGLGRRIGGHRHQQRTDRQQRDRREILVGLEGQLAIQGPAAPDRGRGGDADGVAVGRRPRQRLERDETACADAVFNHHRHAEFLAHVVAEHARIGVGRAARRKAAENADRLGRPGLRMGAGQRSRAKCRERGAMNQPSIRGIDMHGGLLAGRLEAAISGPSWQITTGL